MFVDCTSYTRDVWMFLLIKYFYEKYTTKKKTCQTISLTSPQIRVLRISAELLYSVTAEFYLYLFHYFPD